MQKFLTVLLGILLILLIFLGQTYWNQQNKALSSDTPTSVKKEIIKQKYSSTELLKLTKNWPAEAVERFKQSLKHNKPFKILFVGSPAIGSDTEGAYAVVKQKLKETYGDHIDVQLKTFDMTSTQFISQNKQDEMVAEAADLYIFEPFILENNGEVLIENTLMDLATIMDTVKVANPESTMILQPSYPLYNAKIYPRQVEELKKYAETHQITYLNHWTAWPDPATEEMKDYLNEDQSAPNEKGAQVWGDYIIQYFISK
ncbi:SGNH/GDSL hydrolase family protein [Neobacillus thermocopriae]|uniref:SGNH/GDSL hydrolase family protein n=1 Tax=Neobacillus thermocopriae TaxID=1215031 RepID=UPI00376FFB7D